MTKKWIHNELAWLAGFFDGEGSITLHTSKGGKTHYDNQWHYPHIHIGQVDRRPLERCQEILGFGHIYGPYQHGNSPGAQPRYDFFVRRLDEVLQTIACLWSYLSPPKQEQIRKVMGQWRNAG